jgi:hypothetical protein
MLVPDSVRKLGLADFGIFLILRFAFPATDLRELALLPIAQGMQSYLRRTV